MNFYQIRADNLMFCCSIVAMALERVLQKTTMKKCIFFSTASMSGHVGVLHYIKSEADVDWIIKNGSHAPYVPLFRSDLFTL